MEFEPRTYLQPNPPLSRRIQEFSFVELLIIIVVGWVLVALWQRVVENFAYGTLGLNKDSALHALVVALTATVLFLVYKAYSDEIIGGITTSQIEQSFAPLAPLTK